MYCYDVYEGINHGQVVDYTIDFDGAKQQHAEFSGCRQLRYERKARTTILTPG